MTIAYSIQLLYTSVSALVALKLSMFLSHARLSTTTIIPCVEIQYENLSIDRVTNISENFVEMVGD